MKTTYPVILREVDGGYLVDIPSFEINTFGATQYEAIEMARDAIGAAGIDKIDHGETIPEPMSYKEAKVLGGDDFITVVDIDFDQYRSELDNRLVRKNLTLPYWMNVKAESLGLNFSLALREKVEEYIAESETKDDQSTSK
jgi:predicted RNase H-like HicB family nuclease